MTLPALLPSPGPNLHLVDAELDLDAANAQLASASAECVVEWVYARFGADVITTSSFGAESAVMLHLVTRVIPDVRVVFVDTGYLFPETYRFAEQLRERLNLNLHVYAPRLTPARMEALHGKLWEGDAEDFDRYQELTKVEPMQRALGELAPRAWLAGLRKHQTEFRSGLRKVERSRGIYKVSPILDWTEQDVRRYLTQHELPHHPLVERGYRSIGDHHSTHPVSDEEDARSGRRLGEHRECGIHTRLAQRLEQSRKSSGL